MNYGQYKVVSLKTPSLINKGGDTQLKPRFQLQNGYEYANINDENSIVSVRSADSFLFDVKTPIENGVFLLDFSNENMASLPAGNYEFQITTINDGLVAKYPDVDFVPFTVTTDGRVQPNGLVPQITFDSVLNQVNQDIDHKVNSYLATVAKGDKGDQGDKGEAGKDGKDGVSPTSEYLNIIDFGADPTAVNDSTEAFNKAIKQAEDTGRRTVFVPAGTFVLSSTIRLTEIHLVGENMARSKIRSTAMIAFEVGNFNTIENLKLDSTNADDGAKIFQMGFYYKNSDGVTTYSPAHYSHIDNVIVDGNVNHKETVAFYMRPDFSNTPNAVAGLWGNVFTNIFMFNIANGIVMDTRDYGWINGNKFNNILIAGFQTAGVSLLSTGLNPLGIQHNIFNAIEVEALPQANVGAKAFNITAGSFNFFKNCTTWDDTNGRSDVQPLYFGTSVGYPNYWEIESNDFIGGKLENFVYGDPKVIALNKIDVYQILNNKKPTLFGNKMLSNTYKNVEKTNILPTDIIQHYQQIPALSTVAITNDVMNGSPISGVDELGSYVDIVVGANNTPAINQTLFGDTLKDVIAKKFLSYTVHFTAEDLTNSTVTVQARLIKKDDTSIDLTVDTAFTEALTEADYAYTALIDLAQTDLTNVAYISVTTSIKSVNGRHFLLRDIKAATEPINHWTSYIKEHVGKQYATSVLQQPTSWADLGVYLPNNTAFDGKLLDTKTIGDLNYISSSIII